MGIGPALLDMHLDWMREGIIKPRCWVLEIGAQQFDCAGDPDSINRFLRFFGADPLTPDEAHDAAHHGLVGEVFDRAGFYYRSLDLERWPFVIHTDLNTDTIPTDMHGKFQWVTNHGTSEHVLNQWNIFKTMHDACAEDGVMYHNVPMCDPFHGIFSYSPKLFRALAKANGYEVIRMWAWSSEAPADVRPRFEPDIPFNGPAPSVSMWINAMMRRTNREPFAAPIDGLFEMAAPKLITA